MHALLLIELYYNNAI